MSSFEHPIGKINRTKIIDAIMTLKKASPSQIKAYLDLEAQKKIEKEWLYKNVILSSKEKENRIKKETISDRAIKSSLKRLTNKEKLLVNDNGLYSINDKMRSDIRNFAPQFGGQALAAIMSIHLPTVFKLEKNLDDLIKIFGIYVVYCFIEAARPSVGSKDGSSFLSAKEKDKLASSWVRDVFSPASMYNYFMAAILNQPEDKEVEEYWETLKVNQNGKYIIRNDLSTTSLATKRFDFLVSKDLNYYDKGKPKYELDSKKIKRLTELLKKKYPLYYERLLQARVGFLGRPKDLSVREWSRNIRYFDAKEEDEEQ